MRDFADVEAEVAGVLADPAPSVGHTVCVGHYRIAGNMQRTSPALSAVLVDDLGRFWKEHHRDDGCKLVCIFDMRARR